jgi:DNA-binding CsgD family transcriptional regulator
MDRQETSGEFNPYQYLSKFDMKILIEMGYLCSAHEKPDDIETIFKKMQDLIPFQQILLVRHPVFGNSKPSYTIRGVPEPIVREYLAHEKTDPIASEILRTKKIIDIADFYKKNYSALKKNPVAQIYHDHLKDGLADIQLNDRSKVIIGIAIFGFSARINHRINAIVQYALSFLSCVSEKNRNHEKFTENTSPLTGKEIEILQWLKEGKTSWEISMILHIGESTVNFHVTNIMRKLNATKRTQAVAVAVQNKLIEF